MKRRFSAILLALVLCLGLAAPAFAADDVISGSCGRYTIWTFDRATGTLTISGNGAMSLFWEAGYAVGDWNAIRSVVIEEGVTSVSERAFCDCTGLTKVTLAKSVATVGAGAFSGTLWLRSLGEFAVVNGILLAYQGSAKQVVIPRGVTSIAPGAFFQNQTVTSVVIPEGVVSIGMGGADGLVFAECPNLTDITFPSTLRESGRFNFFLTPWLDRQKDEFVMAGSVLVKYQGKGGDVVIPDGVTALADAAFYGSRLFNGPGQIRAVDTLTVPSSMEMLNADAAFWFAQTEYLPKAIIYKGNCIQWNKIKGTEWLTENGIPVRCTGAVDPAKVFTDMEPNAFYLDGVAWAVANNITNGKTASTFAPKESCTHGHILTFLWRAAGEPRSGIVTPFPMKGDEYYYDAAKWAYEKGMINAAFNPNAPCSRADAVSYIWQARGKPYAVYDGRFIDLPANSPYAQAVAWAVANGVTTGTSATAFSPAKLCDRGTIVTFLYRAYK